MSKSEAAKKWKGKDWFDILAPKFLGGVKIGEVPVTDYRALPGRRVEIGLSEILPETSRYYIKIKLRITEVDGKKAHTRFDGAEMMREQLLRTVRKRTQKVELIKYIQTKDNWKLQAILWAILIRNTNTHIQHNVRMAMQKWIDEFASKSSIDKFVYHHIMGGIQQELKKIVNKIYPCKYTDIVKIEVIKPGQV